MSKRHKKNILLSGEMGFVLFAAVVIFALVVIVGRFILYDPLTVPSNHGTLQCRPLVIGNNFAPTSESDPRYYNGKFLYVRRFEENMISFYDAERHLIKLNNVACILTYDTPI